MMLIPPTPSSKVTDNHGCSMYPFGFYGKDEGVYGLKRACVEY